MKIGEKGRIVWSILKGQIAKDPSEKGSWAQYFPVSMGDKNSKPNGMKKHIWDGQRGKFATSGSGRDGRCSLRTKSHI
jgi:hypothetical protein